MQNTPMRTPLLNRSQRLVRRGLLYSLFLVLAILLLGGVGFWALEPHVKNFSDGLWLAFTTAATVGYGDLGLSVLSLVTASLAAIFVEREVGAEERKIERDLMRELRTLREEVQQLRAEVKAKTPPG